MAPVDDRRHAHQLQHDRTAHESRELGEDREHRHRERRGHHARHHEEADGRQAEGGERVKLLVHLHRADLGGERAAAPPREDDGRHERAKLAEEPDRDEVRHVHLHAEHPQRRRALEGEDEAEEESDRRGDGQAVEPGALERECRVAETEAARVDEQGEGVGEGLAEERAVGARGRAPGAHALAHGHEKRAVTVAGGRLAVIRREVVARADGREQAVRVHRLHAHGARGGVAVEREEERLERRRGGGQPRHVKRHRLAALQAVHAAQLAPAAGDRLRVGAFDDDRLHFFPV